jgi:hypothetical protein
VRIRRIADVTAVPTRWCLLLLLAAGIVWHGPARGDAPDGGAVTWFASSVARGDKGVLLTHYWSKGAKFRAETVAGGRRLITIVDASTYYVIDPTLGEAIGIERSPLAIAGDAGRSRPFGDELSALLAGGGERVGEEKLGGRPTARYQLTNQAGRVQIWVDLELEVPVRVVRYMRGSGDRETLDYLGWLQGLRIADSFFEPPAGSEIERVGYEEYVRRTMSERLGPAPPFYAQLLHGEP